MKMKKIPMRTCVITKEKLDKRDLIRVVRTPEKNVVVDPTGKLNGKGAYLKKDKDRILEVPVPDSIYEDLKNLI